jgi:hypothetical protein
VSTTQPVELLRAELALEHPTPAFEKVLALAKKHPELAREVLFSEGYLYTEAPELAALEVNYLALGLLFREPLLRLARGDQVFLLRRGPDGDYVYEDGPWHGQRATLWLFDRVTLPSAPLEESLTLGLRRARAQAGASEIQIERLTAEGATAILRYGQLEVRAALMRRDGQLDLDCMLAPPELASRIETEHALSLRRSRVTDVLSRIVQGEISEELPFDEPRTEEGQQDGQLRPAWRQAYLRGSDVYTFNDDRYWVFDRLGRPRVPEVCIDFVMDTLERASGNWWRGRADKRERSPGRLDFDQFGLDNRRSVEQFIEFTRNHPEWFEVQEFEGEARIPFWNHDAFFKNLYARRDAFHEFDIVVIFGLRADGKLHYHSFYVVDSDPVTGMPIALAANAGRPRIRSWENEMQSAPQRSVIAHIRPRLTWLESVVIGEPNLSVEPPVSATSPG